jgi:hypothetical protein
MADFVGAIVAVMSTAQPPTTSFNGSAYVTELSRYIVSFGIPSPTNDTFEYSLAIGSDELDELGVSEAHLCNIEKARVDYE